jgi:hypothetical protein
MAGRDYRKYVTSVFEPLARAASRPDLLAKLSTAAVENDRKKEQFSYFKSLKIDSSNIVYLPNGGFAAIFDREDGRFFAVSSAGLNATEEESLITWGASIGLDQTDLDESIFIFLAHELKGYYRLGDRFRAPEEALNAIDIINDEYAGHRYDDLYSFYRPLFLFRIPVENALIDADIFALASAMCVENSPVRSQILDDNVNNALSDLRVFPSVNQESIFQALTSSQWRHVFLEIYRCMESIFYLPWILDLKRSGGMVGRAYDLKYSCRTSLLWREKERPSMEKLFALFAVDAELDAVEDEIEVFRELKRGDNFSRPMLGSRIYTIRNGLVHHEDYEEPNAFRLDDAQWKAVSLYLALALKRILQLHERDLTPSASAAPWR